MRTFTPFLIAFAVVLLAPAVASAQGVDLQPGQKVVATCSEGGGVHHFRFYALPGDTISLTLTIPKKSEFDPVLLLVGPDSEIALPDFVDGRMALDGLVLPDGGRHQFLVYAAGSRGDYSLKFKQKHAKLDVIRRRAGEISLYLTAGATATIQVKVDDGYEGCQPAIEALEDPARDDILETSKYKESKKKAKAKIVKAAVDGEYRIRLAECEGDPYLLVKIKIKAAKPFTKKLNEKTAFESTVVGMRLSESEYVLHAEANGPAVASAFVRFPEGSGIEDVQLPEEDGDFRLDHPGVPQSGIYHLVVTTHKGKEVVKPFLLNGGWPAAPVVSVADHGTTTPDISWTGGGGAEFWYMDIQEWDEDARAWNTKLFTVLPGTVNSYTPPEGPLDDRPHAVHIYAVHRVLKGSYGGWIPD